MLQYDVQVKLAQPDPGSDERMREWVGGDKVGHAVVFFLLPNDGPSTWGHQEYNREEIEDDLIYMRVWKNKWPFELLEIQKSPHFNGERFNIF